MNEVITAQTTISISRETKVFIDKLIAQETKRTGYKIRVSDIVARAVRDLANRVTLTSVKVKKVTKKAKKAKKRTWTPARLAKFRQTMANKKANGSIPVFDVVENYIPTDGLENQ